MDIEGSPHYHRGMRKITGFQIFVFLGMATVVCGFGVYAAIELVNVFSVGAYGPLLTVFLSVLLIEAFAIGTYRIGLWINPLPEGTIEKGSRVECIYHMHLLFFLIFFHPVMRGAFLPLPLMRIFYQALGAKFGENSYSAGLVLDPLFVSFGNNTLVGEGALLTPHIIENEQLAHFPIKVGSNVTVGTGARILAGVVIEDDALISANAVVRKGEHIRQGKYGEACRHESSENAMLVP